MLKLIPILVLLILNACGPDYDAASDVTGLQFDGIDDYILIEENVLPDSGDYTISIWVKADSSNVGARTLISQSDTSGSPFYFGSNSGSDLSGKIKMNQDWKSLESSPFYLDNKWHLYTIVNDGTIGDSSIIIDTSLFYVDGIEISTVMGEGKSYPIDERFFIGTMWDSSGEFFSGAIDDISIWDRKLSSKEISSIYNSGIGLDPTIDSLDYKGSENLIAFWPFSEGADSSVSDFSGNGYDGEIFGASWINIDSKLEPVIDSTLIAESQNQNNSYQKEIWGRVSDIDGKSIYGASVILKGTHNDEFKWTTNFQTNRRGDYEINDCQPWDEMIVSMEGYQTQKFNPLDSIFLESPVDITLLMKTEDDELVIDSAMLAEISRQAEENYEMIQYMINSARQNQVVSIPEGVHIISKPITVNKKVNITIQGTLSSSIVLNDIHQPVFVINNSSNIVIQRLSLGHEPTIKGDHDSEVVRINKGNNIYVNSCEISGEAAIGLKAVGVKSLTISSCFIHDNSWFAFSFKDCDNVTIENSQLIDNQEVMYKRSSTVALHSNVIKD
ncbi:MAG: LamG-like jellyroll fold domain-containing protein [bacterium]